MTDELSISYSHVSSPAAAGLGASAFASPEPELVAFADCEIIPLDSQRTLVINRLNGKQQFFAPGVVDALMTCTHFDTIENHTRRLCATRGELRGQEQAVATTLGNLRSNDFLLLHNDIQKRLATTDSAELAPSCVFIITCDRPTAVERLLDSLLHNGNMSRHRRLTLIDDSRESDNQAANQDLVAQFNLRSATNMDYFGPTEQQSLLDGLIAALPEAEDGIRFLLDREQWTGKKTYGRSRTLALLLSVDHRSVVMDDDVICQALKAPIKEPGISFTGLREAEFYPDRDTLMAHGVAAETDPVTGHLKYLGQNLGYALQDMAGGPVNATLLHNTNAAMLNELRADAPILITQCGSWGDPGTGSPHWALSLDESSIERLVNAPHGMARALENRCSWVGCPRPTLHKMAFMSQITGIDNSHLLPPYFPAFRGEDLLFASMVEAMYHHGAVLEYDWCIPHLPLDDRSDHGLREPIAGEGGIALFSRYLLENIDYKDASNPEQRLMILADDARRLAARSDHDLILDYRREQAKGQAQLLFNVTQKSQAAKELPSANWQAYTARAVEEVESSIAEVHSPVNLKGLPPGATEEGLIAEFRTYANGWAAALQAWPAMRSAAAKAMNS